MKSRSQITCQSITFQLSFVVIVTDDADVAFGTELVAADAAGRESNECLYEDCSRGCLIVLTSPLADI